MEPTEIQQPMPEEARAIEEDILKDVTSRANHEVAAPEPEPTPVAASAGPDSQHPDSVNVEKSDEGELVAATEPQAVADNIEEKNTTPSALVAEPGLVSETLEGGGVAPDNVEPQPLPVSTTPQLAEASPRDEVKQPGEEVAGLPDAPAPSEVIAAEVARSSDSPAEVAPVPCLDEVQPVEQMADLRTKEQLVGEEEAPLGSPVVPRPPSLVVARPPSPSPIPSPAKLGVCSSTAPETGPVTTLAPVPEESQECQQSTEAKPSAPEVAQADVKQIEPDGLVEAPEKPSEAEPVAEEQKRSFESPERPAKRRRRSLPREGKLLVEAKFEEMQDKLNHLKNQVEGLQAELDSTSKEKASALSKAELADRQMQDLKKRSAVEKEILEIEVTLLREDRGVVGGLRSRQPQQVPLSVEGLTQKVLALTRNLAEEERRRKAAGLTPLSKFNVK